MFTSPHPFYMILSCFSCFLQISFPVVPVVCRFHMSMMEIYNEAVYDLLRPESKDSRQSASPGGGTKTSLDIRQNATGGTSVPGLTEV